MSSQKVLCSISQKGYASRRGVKRHLLSVHQSRYNFRSNSTRVLEGEELKEAVKTAVINKRAGGMGLISGRKAFQKTLVKGVELLHAIQDVYLCKDVTVA